MKIRKKFQATTRRLHKSYETDYKGPSESRIESDQGPGVGGSCGGSRRDGPWVGVRTEP